MNSTKRAYPQRSTTLQSTDLGTYLHNTLEQKHHLPLPSSELHPPSQEKVSNLQRVVDSGKEVALFAYLEVVERRLVEGWERIAVDTAVDLGLRRLVEVVVGSTTTRKEMTIGMRDG